MDSPSVTYYENQFPEGDIGFLRMTRKDGALRIRVKSPVMEKLFAGLSAEVPAAKRPLADLDLPLPKPKKTPSQSFMGKTLYTIGVDKLVVIDTFFEQRTPRDPVVIINHTDHPLISPGRSGSGQLVFNYTYLRAKGLAEGLEFEIPSPPISPEELDRYVKVFEKVVLTLYSNFVKQVDVGVSISSSYFGAAKRG